MLWVSGVFAEEDEVEDEVVEEDGGGGNADAGKSSPLKRLTVKMGERNAMSWLGRARARVRKGLRVASDIAYGEEKGGVDGEGGGTMIGGWR